MLVSKIVLCVRNCHLRVMRCNDSCIAVRIYAVVCADCNTAVLLIFLTGLVKPMNMVCSCRHPEDVQAMSVSVLPFFSYLNLKHLDPFISIKLG